MKINKKTIFAIIWVIFCIFQISQNCSNYTTADFVVVIIITILPFCIYWIFKNIKKHKNSNSDYKNNNISNTCVHSIKFANHKNIIIIIAVIFAIICGYKTQNSEQHQDHEENILQYQDHKENIPMILNCSQFSRISVETLKNELGEPVRIEDWNNQNAKGNFPMQIYTYNFDDFYSEFILYDDIVVKVRLFSNSKWIAENLDIDNIFPMFGIIPDENLKKIVDNGITYKFSPVSDKIAEFELFNYDKENKTFDTVYITYNLNYFV